MAFPSTSSPSDQDAVVGHLAVEEFTFDFELSPYDSYPAPGELNYRSFPLMDHIQNESYDFGRTSIQSGPTAQTTVGSMPLWPLSSSSPSYESWSPSSSFGTNSSVGPSDGPLTPEWLFQSPLGVECQLPQAESEIETFAGLSLDFFDPSRGIFVDETPSQCHDFTFLSGSGAYSTRGAPLSIEPSEMTLFSTYSAEVQYSSAAPNTFASLSPASFDMVRGEFVDESPSSTPFTQNSPPSIQLATHVQQSASTNARFQCALCPHSFPKSYNLRRHMNTKHAQSQRFTCSYCPKTMSRADNMKQHEGTCRKRPTDAEAGPSSSSRKGSKHRRERPTAIHNGADGCIQYNANGHYD